MAYDISLWENLVYVIFGNAFLFLMVMIGFFLYYMSRYDFEKWVIFIFLGGFIAWVAIVAVGLWALIPILIAAAFWFGISAFRFLRQ